jgi:hypothetical protein
MAPSEGSATLLADSLVWGAIIGPSGRQGIDYKVSAGDFNPRALQAKGVQLTRPPRPCCDPKARRWDTGVRTLFGRRS